MTQRDIVIAGGGMVGLSLALLLGAQLPPGARICLVEGFRLPDDDAAGPPAYHPSFDARSTALSYSTRLIYEQAGFWERLQQWLCPIETIHVSMKGRFGSTLMDASACDWPALGYVVENAWLGRALLQAVQQQGRVELLSPAKVVDAQARGEWVELGIEGGDTASIHARLLVVADGADSGLRRRLGMHASEKAYGQHALIANIATDQPHRGCAFERFTDRGPLALLPLLPAPAAQCRSALVWTLPPEQAQQLETSPEPDFLQALQSRFGYRLGRLLKVGQRHSYPLGLMQASEQVRQGIVVMGNAAHALHPVAGQGYNLALRDVAQLADTLAGAAARGVAPGDLGLLQGYLRRQRQDQQRTIGASDLLPGLFMQGNPLFGAARDLALSALDVLPPLKREFVRYAAGVGESGVSGRG